jgi:hypothetical protein
MSCDRSHCNSPASTGRRGNFNGTWKGRDTIKRDCLDRWGVRSSAAKMRSFLTLPRSDRLGDPTDSRSRSASMCRVAFTRSLSRPRLPCGLRPLFNSPPQPLAECNQGMPVPQSQRNLAGLLVHSDVGIGLVWFLDDQDAPHNANPEESARPECDSRLKWDVADRTRAAPLFVAPSGH